MKYVFEFSVPRGTSMAQLMDLQLALTAQLEDVAGKALGMWEKNPPEVFRVFNRIAFPSELKALGFTDGTEWNDACGRACFPINPNRDLVVWCDYEEEFDREMQGAQYIVQDWDYDSEPKTLGEFETLPELLAFLKQRLS